MSTTVFGIGGVARAGKDTFTRLFAELHWKEGYYCRQIAFADALKHEIADEMMRLYGLSVYTQDSAEKAIIRPHLVELGRRRREESNGEHWIKSVEPQVKRWLDDGDNVAVTDVRYANEATWIHSLDGKVIYIERLVDGVPVLPANGEEAINDPKVRAMADLVVTMPTFGADYLDNMRPYVQSLWRQLNPVNS